MGKIHDALEKAGKTSTRQSAAAVMSKPGKASTRQSAAVMKPKPEKANAASKPNTVVPTHAADDPFSYRAGTQIDPLLVAYHQPASVEAEIFKMLRTSILFPKSGEPPKTIMVTSALPGEGKSFVAANLAVSIAQGIEEHVLLMDCDMRRSSIHRSFGYADTTPGLSNYLAQKTALPSLLKKTVVEKLTILPGGPTPPNPAELLSSQAMKGLLQESRERYQDRYVLLDSPPPQMTAETAALAKSIDGIILVVRYGATPKDLIKELTEQLGKEKIIGVVMNRYRVPALERYGHRRYGRNRA